MLRKILVASVSMIALSTATSWAANTSTVTQDSTTSNVSATVSQTGPTGSFSDIQQYNNTANSDAFVTQIDAGGPTPSPVSLSYLSQINNDGSTAVVYQDGSTATGNHNEAETLQEYGASNYAATAQAGGGLISHITQGDGTTFSSGNIGLIAQIGEGSAAEVRQVGSNNYGEIYQDGDFSGVSITQTGDDNIATLFQVGDSVNAPIVQTGSFLEAHVAMDGFANSAGVNQNGTDHFASITQLGDLNAANIGQTGTSHTATVSQTGESNLSQLFQTGSNNTASVSQTGTGFTSTINQDGTGGTVTVIQN
jgi:trimeric autotransporter adhesin